MEKAITIFLCGDVMTGRGIDQVLPHPNLPDIHEPFMKSAMGYVRLAEDVNGPIRRPVDFSYIWGEALDELNWVRPDFRIVNLETSVTKSEDYEDKGINYRMRPDNIGCITAAGIDCASLANNHILDWGYAGLIETLETLKKAGVKSAGAGRDLREAQAPAILDAGQQGRILFFSFGSHTSGIPFSWAATESRPGVNMIGDFSAETIGGIKQMVAMARRRGDIVIASIHWGGNWGYKIQESEREFARRLIDEACVDVIHGHSSHHVKGIEVHKERLILYGCGDFLNDYEGISGYEEYRPDLGLMYFAAVEPEEGRLVALRMKTTTIQRFRIVRALETDALLLRDILNREGRGFGTRAELNEDGTLYLLWNS